MSLGSLACALAAGICTNLRDMLPAEFQVGRESIAASGNALERNPALCRAAEAVFGLPVVLCSQTEAAAVGAARNAAAMTMEAA
jgi:ribulose kinase